MEKTIYILITAALFLTSCSKHERTHKERDPLRVKTMVVQPQTDISVTRYVGTIAPARETPLSMLTSGRVVSLRMKNGDRVQKGQTILELDNTQALNAVETAQAALRHAEDGFERLSKVHPKGVVSDQKLVEVESQYTQAKSVYAAAKKQLQECSLIAPCDGLINGLNVQIGQTVLPGMKICSLLDVKGFEVKFTVPEGEIGKFSLDKAAIQRGEVECAAVDSTFPIVITEKSATANVLAHTYEVKARIEGGADVLMAGMVGKVQLQGEKGQRAEDIVVPSKCILLKPEGPTVWVKENGLAVRRMITIDGYQADGVRVRSGLNAGDSLIIEGYQKLYNNCKIVENE